MAADAEFKTFIARAREAQQHAMIDETVDMADQATPEDWQAVKLRIWARQWRAAKLAPRDYGERITQEHTGSVGFVMYGEPEKASTQEWAETNGGAE